jgi:hypothetical protein
MSRHDWGAIERALTVERMTVPEVVEKFSVPRTTVYNRARRKGWELAPAPRSVGVRSAPDGDGPDVAALLSRLKQAMTARLSNIELDTGAEEADPDRHARTIDAALRTMKRIEALERARAARPRPPWEWTEEQREAKRAALAERVIRMIEQIRGEPLPD